MIIVLCHINCDSDNLFWLSKDALMITVKL